MGEEVEQLRCVVDSNRDQLGMIVVRDKLSGEVMFKCKTAPKAAVFVAKQQEALKIVCEEIGITLEEGLGNSIQELQSMLKNKQD